MNRIDAYEWLAGKLIVRAAKARHRRAGSDDAHEMRHLLAAVTAGNSSNCDHGRTCHLDAALMQRLHDGTWPEHDLEGNVRVSGLLLALGVGAALGFVAGWVAR